jgi:Lon protease-like protein
MSASNPPEDRPVALFPLGLVQFPAFPLELQVFEPRYLRMLSDLRRRGTQEFGVVTIRSGHEVGVGNIHELADVGCMVRIEATRPDGDRILLRGVGTWRFDRIELLEHGRAYVTARVRRLPDDSGVPDPEAVERLHSALLAYAATSGVALPTLPEDIDERTWFITAGGPLTEAEQLRALAAPRAERMALLTEWLRREAGLLRSTHSLPFRADRTPPTN